MGPSMLITLHLSSSLLKQILLLAKIELILLLFFLFELFFPFFPFFLAAIRTGKCLKFLGIGYLKLMSFLLAFKCNFGVEKPIYHLDIMLGRNLFAGVIEFLAFVAPIIWGSKDFRGSGSWDTFCLNDFEGFDGVNWHKEGVIVLASELNGVSTLTNTETCGETLSSILLGKETALLKDLVFRVSRVNLFSLNSLGCYSNQGSTEIWFKVVDKWGCNPSEIWAPIGLVLCLSFSLLKVVDRWKLEVFIELGEKTLEISIRTFDIWIGFALLNFRSFRGFNFCNIVRGSSFFALP